MLHFNARGHLVPTVSIPSTLSVVKATFAGPEVSMERRALFDKYMEYSLQMRTLCSGPIVQWINGSFCTTKLVPADIDLVSFVFYKDIEKNERKFAMYSYPQSELQFGVDAYIVKVYPEGHRYGARYFADHLYWLQQFSRTAPGRAGRRYEKGFLEIIV